MLNLFYRNNGSITVFLSIILVPMLLFMSIMVDGSAYVLSKGTVESAGELATNAALADYDTVLKEVYGLFAMSQAAEDPQAALQENVNRYFQDSLVATGILDSDSVWNSALLQDLETTIDEAMNIYGDAVPGLVQVDVENSTTVNYVEGSSLADPDVMWAQIVEYSQYRAPINAGLSLLDSMGAFTKVAAQSNVMDSKTKVDDALQDVNESLKALYDDIVDFDTLVAELQDALLAAENADFSYEEAQTALLICHSVITELEMEPLAQCGANNTGAYSSLYDYNKIKFVVDDGQGGYDFRTVENGEMSLPLAIDYWKKNQFVATIREKFQKYNDEGVESGVRKEVEDKYNSLNMASYFSQELVEYATFSGMDTNNVCNTSTKSNPTKLKAALDAFKQFDDKLVELEELKVAVDYAKIHEYEYPESVTNPSDSEINEHYTPYTGLPGESQESIDAENSERWDDAEEAAIKENKEEYDELQKTLFENAKNELRVDIDTEIKKYMAGSTKCFNALKTYQNAYIKYHNSLKDYLVKINGLLSPLEEPIVKVAYDETFQWNGFLQWSHETAAQHVRDRVEDVRDYITELKTQITNHQTNITNYERDAMDGSSDTFSTTLSSEAKELAEKYDAADLQEIVDQVNAVEKYITNPSNPRGLMATLESYQLGGLVIFDYFHGYEVTPPNSQIEGLIDKIVESYSGNGEYSVVTQWNIAKAGTYYEFDKNTQSIAQVDAIDDSVMYKMGEDENNPFNAHNTDHTCYLKRICQAGVKTADGGNSINIPAFYFYLITLFGKEAQPVGEDQISKDELDNVQSGTETEAQNDNAQATSSFTYDKDTLFVDAPTGSGSGSSESSDEENGDSPFAFFRRAIDTFGNMISVFVNIASAENPIEDIGETLLVEEYILNNFSLYSDKKEYDENEVTRQTYSNVEINPENNAMFGCEVEYIIYGQKGQNSWKFLFLEFGQKKGPEMNINYAKEDIFAVRMVFNTVFALTDAQLDKETMPPAMAIQAATGGVFPYQVAQAIIKVCLALAESNYDVKQIVDENTPMPLVKTKETWKFQLSGLKDMAKNAVQDAATDVTQFVEEDLTQATKDGLQKVIDGVKEEGNAWVASMSTNIQTVVRGSVDDLVNGASQCYTATIEAYYQQLLINGQPYSRTELIGQCEAAALAYLDEMGYGANADASKQATRDLIVSQLIPKLTENMLGVGGVLDTQLGQIESLIDTTTANVEATTEALYTNFQTTINQVSQTALDAIQDVETSVIDLTNNIADDVTAAMKTAVDEAGAVAATEMNKLSEKASQTINSKLDEYFPSATVTTNLKKESTETSAALGSGFVMGYDDYIRIFLLIKLLSDDRDQTVSRIADVIQININQGLETYSSNAYTHPKKESFKMKDAYTYVEVQSAVKVDPLLISQDWFERISGDRIQYLQYEYNTIAGY